jgi:hypothetical protein
MPPATNSTIIGLVDAGGSGGGSAGQSDRWSLIFHLAGWRHPGSAMAMGERRCELPVSQDELPSLMVGASRPARGPGGPGGFGAR